MAEGLSGLLLIGLIVICIFYEPIIMFWALREIRRMAETLPEKDRERWINESVASLTSKKKKPA